MKKIQRFFGRSNVSNPPEEGGCNASAPRRSSARRRSTERRSQLESEEVGRTEAASSSSSFANYRRVVDDYDHVSKMNRTRDEVYFILDRLGTILVVYILRYQRIKR